MEITTDVPLHPFLFVGCWNNPTTRDYERVFQKIQEDPITTLILGGDNIYPFKDENGNKRYNVDEVEKGFRIAKEGKNIVYTALGNHNITNPQVFDKEKELYTLPSRYYSVHFSDNYSLVFLDSNLFKTGGDALTSMFDWLRELIGKIGPYYLVQHHPIAGIRDSGPSFLKYKNQLLQIIQNNLPIAVFSSHIHLFQHGLIQFQSRPHDENENKRASPNLGLNRKEINQYIVGTGGAVLDGIPSRDDSIIIEGNFFEYRVLETQKTYGYSRITAPGVVEFIPVRSIVGGRRKTKTRRSSKKKSIASS
jgi:hypothetical protein